MAKLVIRASDNVGVSKVELYIDGALAAESFNDTIRYRWDARTAAASPHLFSAKAYDAAGNVGVYSITLYK